MGQYFIAVNTTKREWIHPHRFGDGLKFPELCSSGYGFLAGLATLIKQTNDPVDDLPIVGSWAGDNITLPGDYDSRQIYHDAMDSYRDVSFDVLAAMVRDPYVRASLLEATEWRRASGYGSLNSDPEERAMYKNLFKE